MTAETSALWRMERALGLHAWRRLVARLALLHAGWTWKTLPWQTWLHDRRLAAQAAVGQARTQYGDTLRYRAGMRKRQSPEGVAAAELNAARGLESDARAKVLWHAREAQQLAWAPRWVLPSRALFAGACGVAVGGVWMVIVFGVGSRTWWPPVVLFAVVALFVWAFAFMVKAGADARRHVNWSDRLRNSREDYDGAWYRLRAAERASGVQWGVTRVVSPRGLPDDLTAAGTTPSDELVAVRRPERIDDEVIRLREGVDPAAEALRERYRRAADVGVMTRAWDASHPRLITVPSTMSGSDADRLRRDYRRIWSVATIGEQVRGPRDIADGPREQADLGTVRERADALHGGR